MSPPTTPNPLTADQQLAVELLVAVNVKPVSLAIALAQENPFDRIRQCVAHWWLNRKSAGGIFLETPGVVLYWLTHWDVSSIPPLHPDFFGSELYHTYRPQAEIAAEQAAEEETLQRLAQWHQQAIATLQHQNADPVSDPSVPALYATAWRNLIAELETSLHNSVYTQFIRDNLTLTHVQEPPPQLTFTVRINRAYTVDWITRQLQNSLTRKLRVVFGQPITINFQT